MAFQLHSLPQSDSLVHDSCHWLGKQDLPRLILRLCGRSRTFLRHDRSWSRQFFHHDDLAHLAMIPLGTTVFKTTFATLECCYSILQEKKIAEYQSKELEDFRQTLYCWTVDILCFLSALMGRLHVQAAADSARAWGRAADHGRQPALAIIA